MPLSHEDYTVGWICALPLEMAAAKLMLDAIHPSLPRPPNDQNTYILGNVGKHKVVIAGLPSGAYGNTSATSVGMQLLSSFPAIRIGLMVGIAGGVPSNDADIRLGDIVVSQPSDTFGGVVQYDLGKVLSDGRFTRTGMLNRPPKVLLTALAALQAHHLTEESRVVEFVSNIQAKIPPRKATTFARPTQVDCLFQVEYDHVASSTCLSCDRSKLCPRPPRDREEPVVHYGLIGSANRVVKDGRQRDQLARDLGIYCVEMEAAGLMNDFPCLVVRGICNYADSHKNKEWQGYAAAVAAAYAKELLLVVLTDKIHSAPTVHTLPGSDLLHRFDVPLDLTAVPVIGNFVGRQDELDQLWQYLRPTDPRSRKVAILHGLGGIGKTQLAIRFARSHKDDFTAIFWLSGKDRGTLLQSLSSVLHRLPGQSQNDKAVNEEEVEQRARHVLRWLALEGNSRWLIVFDNIDQYLPINGATSDVYDITEFFPTADHGSILLTSRLQRLAELGRSFQLNRLDYKDAIQLLLQSTCLSASGTVDGLESNPDTLALAFRLDGLPLAIVIAGAFMRETGTSVTEYLQYYQNSWSELQLQSNPQRQYQQGNLLQTWMISYHEIQKRDPHAAKLLLLLAHFDNRDIWYELIKSSHNSSYVPFGLAKTISSGLAFRTSVKNLIAFSLLDTKVQAGSYTIHPVVQDWCIHLSSTDTNANSTQLNKLALIAVGNSVPRSSDRNYSELQQRLIPHADYVRRGDWSSDNMDIGIWKAFDSLGSLYSDQGKLKEAEEMYLRALAGYEKALGPDHTSTLSTVNSLGNLYRNQGNLKEAEEMHQRTLVGYEKALGPDHTSTLGTVNNLGVLYSVQGRLKEAEEMYLRALAGYEKALGPDHISPLNTVGNLGNLYRNQGNLKEAEEMHQRALVGYEKALGPDHSSTLNTVNNLGNLYRNQGRLKETEEMYQRALSATLGISTMI
ncbi:Putative TPR repeat protein [Penicillium brasilianum]|uniref:Putative TPR repeat protein n=1 Tax=Penicillium brasilianum TaxID=104259 RepID=A0A0F7U5G3_PENBI|nr:Putative TPR repeat protein [Penicillium brasilianum]